MTSIVTPEKILEKYVDSNGRTELNELQNQLHDLGSPMSNENGESLVKTIKDLEVVTESREVSGKTLKAGPCEAAQALGCLSTLQPDTHSSVPSFNYLKML